MNKIWLVCVSLIAIGCNRDLGSGFNPDFATPTQVDAATPSPGPWARGSYYTNYVPQSPSPSPSVEPSPSPTVDMGAPDTSWPVAPDMAAAVPFCPDFRMCYERCALLPAAALPTVIILPDHDCRCACE
jgi:hypothetical protein